ncbi:MAG: lipase family protein [Planctomycetota bacterium]|nr:MAG: lipase family protein [Planctomycetota bacterium]
MNGFNPHATEYNVHNAYWLAEASKLAYADKDEIENNVTNEWQLDKFKFIREKDTERMLDTQLFIAGNDQILIIAFKGTTNIPNWITDIRIEFRDGPLGKVHHGFLDAYELVREETTGAIEFVNSDNKPRTLWITGHSLGGALATVAVAGMIQEGKSVQGMYTYGQPRVGDKQFAKQFNKAFKARAFRHVNNEDFVTRVPIWSLPRHKRYKHIGTCLYFDKNGKLHVGALWWFIFLLSVHRAFEDLREMLKETIEDHKIENYIALIEQLKGNHS